MNVAFEVFTFLDEVVIFLFEMPDMLVLLMHVVIFVFPLMGMT